MFSIARGARSSKAEDARPAAEAETIRREGIEAVARLTAEQPARLIEMPERYVVERHPKLEWIRREDEEARAELPRSRR